MKNTKKVLSVVLAVIMALGVFSIMAFAHSATGTEVANTVSVKYEVSQVPSAVDIGNSGETYTAVDNDIYAVTCYAKAPAGVGVYYLQIPIQFDENKFEPMMQIDSGDLYTGYPTYFDDAGSQVVGFYTFPERFSDSNMYKADGTITTSNMQAKVYGLGNSKAGTFVKDVNFKGLGVPGADNLKAHYAAGIGLVLVTLDDAGLVNKTAFINTENGLLSSEYLEIVTVYFKRLDGVTEDQCYGTEFGLITGNAYEDQQTQLTSQVATNGGYVDGADDPLTTVNYINGAVEAPVKPLCTFTAAGNAKSQAIAFNLSAAATSPYDADDVESVDYRFVAQFSTSAFPIDYNADGTVNSTDIDEVGYVMAKVGDATAAQLTAYDAAGIAGLSKDSGTIRKCWTAKISTDMAGGAAFAFSCRIKGIAVTGGTVASEYIVAPYVLANGHVYYGQAQTSTVQAKYDANIAKFLANKNA